MTTHDDKTFRAMTPSQSFKLEREIMNCKGRRTRGGRQATDICGGTHTMTWTAFSLLSAKRDAQAHQGCSGSSPGSKDGDSSTNATLPTTTDEAL